MDKDLINRLSRVQGQIEALKKSLQEDASDNQRCLGNARLLKASINGLKKFGAAYMSKNIQTCLKSDANGKELETLLRIAINTGFDL